MKIILYIIILLQFSCEFHSGPEKTALNFMRFRYFEPSKAFDLVKEGNVDKKEFMIKHEEMLRIKDFKLKTLIHFDILEKAKPYHNNTVIVKVQTTRPDVNKVFQGFYTEKIANGWDKKQIKKELNKRLRDPNAPKETLQDDLILELTNKGWKILYKN